jgi:hypothetical protein
LVYRLIYDPLEDGEEIEWIDHTGESVEDMLDRIIDENQLEAFTIPKNAKAEQDVAPNFSLVPTLFQSE